MSIFATSIVSLTDDGATIGTDAGVKNDKACKSRVMHIRQFKLVENLNQIPTCNLHVGGNAFGNSRRFMFSVRLTMTGRARAAVVRRASPRRPLHPGFQKKAPGDSI
jgi:hypothetical protein